LIPLRAATVRGKHSPNRSMRRVLLVVSVFACLLLPAAARAASGDAVVRDCVDNGKLDHSYSQSQLRQGLAHLPTDIQEYTDCRDVISRAMRAAASSKNHRSPAHFGNGFHHLGAGGGRSGGGGGKGGGGHGAGGGGDPGADAALASSGSPGQAGHGGGSSLPTPLLIALIALGVAALSGGGYGAYRYRGDILRVLRREA
jgi:hypothetical protein